MYRSTFPNAMRAGFLLAGLGAGTAASAGEAGDWDWMAEPYLWAASIGTDLRTIDPPTEAESESSFSELDGVFMVRVEGRNEQWGAFADFIYPGLSDSTERRFARTENDIDARLLDAALSHGQAGSATAAWTCSAACATSTWTSTCVSSRTTRPGRPAASTPAPATSTCCWAPATPGRSTSAGALVLRGDGSVGETDGTWSASAMGNYRTGNGAWLFGYRYLEGKLGNDNADVTLDLSGPVVGYGFRF